MAQELNEDVLLILGQKYECIFQDCCIQGEFVSTLTSITYDDDDKKRDYPIYSFQNGVELSTFYGCVFGAVE